MRFESEKDVAQPVVEWLEMNGWEVYEEIKPFDSSGVADIVAIKDGLQWIIEVKRSLTLELMAQAAKWMRYDAADFISVAVPAQKETRFSRKSNGRWFAEGILEDRGIGIFEVNENQGISQCHEPKQTEFKREKKGYFYDAIRDSCHVLSKGYAKAGSRAGVHWSAFKDKVMIGDTTLYRADCMDVLPMLNKVDAVVTDPPYNAKKGYGPGKDDLPESEYADKMYRITTAARAICDKQFWVAPRYKMHLWTGLLPGAHLVVIRRGASGCLRGGWADQFETCLVIGKPSRTMPDLWEDIRLKGEGYFFREDTFDHPGYTPYPIMARGVELFSDEGGVVLDPFMGSGTCGVAALKLGRKFVGIEIEQKYFDIAVERIGKEANQMKMFQEDK